MDGPQESGALARYLAGHDALCPGCGYNLRGAVGGRCPECAHALQLGIVRPGPGPALTWFLLLAFGWVFAASVMNSARSVERVRLSVASVRNFGYPFPPRPVTNTEGFWEIARTVVPADTWFGAVWSLTLSIGCGVGLLLMAVRRSHPFGADGERRMVGLACGLFAIYASWHVVSFILEFS